MSVPARLDDVCDASRRVAQESGQPGGNGERLTNRRSTGAVFHAFEASLTTSVVDPRCRSAVRDAELTLDELGWRQACERCTSVQQFDGIHARFAGSADGRRLQRARVAGFVRSLSVGRRRDG